MWVPSTDPGCRANRKVYLQGEGKAVPDVVLFRFGLFDFPLKLHPLLAHLLQDLLPLMAEFIL